MKLTRDNFIQFKVYESILDCGNDGVNVVDNEGILIYVNKISADYANYSKQDMIGQPIEKFFPDAVLLNVLKNKHAVLDKKIHYVGNKKYVVSSYPIYNGNEFLGSFSVFKDIKEMDDLNKKVKYLELQVSLNKPEENIKSIVDEGTLNKVFQQARRTVGSLGGPRHSIITGESGTGKTMLANLIYNYAKKIGVINKDAPFIEINCAQFTNPDIAAMEIFGSEEGAYTGSKKKKGLFEQANGGILFLDEAHTLENYQNMLLKAIESGKIRRIGDTKEISIDVIIIAASTRNLQEVLLPELYQRLGQYEMYLPSLRERSLSEKKKLFEHFVSRYEVAVEKSHKIKYRVVFTDSAKEALLGASYPRNIRQFRDVINYSIDASAPLIEDIENKNEITTVVDIDNIPFEIFDEVIEVRPRTEEKLSKITKEVEKEIFYLKEQGYGPRKISKRLNELGYNIEYYKVAYFLKGNKWYILKR